MKLYVLAVMVVSLALGAMSVSAVPEAALFEYDCIVYWFDGPPLDSGRAVLGATNPANRPITIHITDELMDLPAGLRETLAHEVCHALGWYGHPESSGLMKPAAVFGEWAWPPPALSAREKAFLEQVRVVLWVNWDATRPELGEAVRDVAAYLNAWAGRPVVRFHVSPDTLK